MNILTILIALLSYSNSFNTGEITADEVAKRYCNCAQEYNLTLTAKSYKEAKDAEIKEKAKGDYLVSLRKTQECIKMQEVQESVRKLPREQRSQFEKNVMKILTERCTEVALALQMSR
jgi:ATP-dependent 26S proteasome regulatory subunit